MAASTGIDWADKTWPVIAGCDLESPGCINCYAINDAWRMGQNPNPKIAAKYAGLVARHAASGTLVWTGKINFHEPHLLWPLRWRTPSRIFLTSEGDLFHPDVPVETIDRILAVASVAWWHDFQILTKRSARMCLYFLDPATPARIAEQIEHLALDGAGNPHRRARMVAWQLAIHLVRGGSWPMPNFWLISSVEDQKRAELRRESMRRLSAAGWITGVSYEPALETVQWGGWEFLDWLVAGGESGARARPSHPEWFRAARDWCALHGVAFLFKQWGAWAPIEIVPGGDLGGDMRRGRAEIVKAQGEKDGHFRRGDALMGRAVKKRNGRVLDGVLHDAYPARAQTTLRNGADG